VFELSRVLARLCAVAAAGALAVMGPLSASQSPISSAPPAIGDKAPDFTLPGVDGTDVKLSAELQRGPVVLILLRGWPGYQCPFCVRQYGDFIRHGDELASAGARVIWVYPGLADVQQRAAAFAAGAAAPSHFRLALDASFAFTNAYHLRWDAKNETTYPSTFVIDKRGVIRWAQISRTHDGRALATDVLTALAKLSR
jgi:peroxiredoxin Q/BCP